MTTIKELSRNSRSLLSVILLVGFLLPQAALPSQFIGYGILTAIYAIFVLSTLLFDDKPKFIGTRRITMFFVVIWLLFLTHVATAESLGSVLRAPAFTVFTALNVFYLPRYLPPRLFYWTLSRIGATVAILGLVPIIGGPTSLGALDLSLWGPTVNRFGFPIRTVTSIFLNPNTLGLVCVFGLLSSIAEYRLFSGSFSGILAGINTIGLVYSNFRTGMVVVFATGVLYLSYHLYGQVGVAGATVAGSSITLVGLGMILGLLPGPEPIVHSTLNGRERLWEVGVKVWRERPIVGVGFVEGQSSLSSYYPGEDKSGVHNSYLRMFMATGVLGGFSYLMMTGDLLVSSLRSTLTESDLFLYLFFAAVVIIQITDHLTLFGLSTGSMLFSLTFGLILHYNILSRRCFPS